MSSVKMDVPAGFGGSAVAGARTDALGTRFAERQPARVMIVDDHPLMRRGLVALLEEAPDLVLCAEVAGVEEALGRLDDARPDLVLVDLSLKQGSGLALIERIRARQPSVRMLVASMHDEALYAERVLRAGAQGYINKQEASENLIHAIRMVLKDQVYLSQRMTERLLSRMIDGEQVAEDPLHRLTNRELEVFGLIGQGMTIKQIAHKLLLSPKTVETHREKIKTKLNASNGAEVNRRAIQWVLETAAPSAASDLR